jgi:hypothetical protein
MRATLLTHGPCAAQRLCSLADVSLALPITQLPTPAHKQPCYRSTRVPGSSACSHTPCLYPYPQVPTSPNELPSLDITSVEEFTEDVWVEALIDDMTALENELAEVFDCVAPCFPPSFGVFEQVGAAGRCCLADAVREQVGAAGRCCLAGAVREQVHWATAGRS